MFFDRLFKLQSLKFHLLGSTSFVQNAQQFSPGKFRKEGAMLSPLIAELKAAAQIDWSVDGEDTQIVYTGGETDELVMTLEGFTDELTIAHFDIV